MIAALSFVAALAIGAGAEGDRAARDFAAANELALKGEHAGAIALYEGLLAQGVAHADLFLNLGNAYAESGREVDAIVAFERGLRLEPGDADLRANLQFLRARIETPAESDVVLADVIEPFVSQLPLMPFAWAALVFNLILFAALLLRRRAISIAAAVLLAAALLGVGGHYVLSSDPRAVVLESSEVKEGPHERFKVNARIPAGARVRILDEDGAFVRILRQDGTTGWITSRAVARV